MGLEYISLGYSNYGDFTFDVDLDKDELVDIQFEGSFVHSPAGDDGNWANGIKILDDQVSVLIETAWDTLCLDTIYFDVYYAYYVIKDCEPGEFSSITEYQRTLLFNEAELENIADVESSIGTPYISLGYSAYNEVNGSGIVGDIYRGVEWNGPREAFLVFEKTTPAGTERYAIKISGNGSSCYFLTVDEIRKLDCPE